MKTLTLKAWEAGRLEDAFARAYQRRGVRSLARIQHAFGATKTDLGRLFGRVSRQAIDDWLRKGVPASRTADVARIDSLAQTLLRRFKPERLPQIVREPMPGLGGRSIFQAIEADGTVPVFEMLEHAFSYHGS